MHFGCAAISLPADCGSTCRSTAPPVLLRALEIDQVVVLLPGAPTTTLFTRLAAMAATTAARSAQTLAAGGRHASSLNRRVGRLACPLAAGVHSGSSQASLRLALGMRTTTRRQAHVAVVSWAAMHALTTAAAFPCLPSNPALSPAPIHFSTLAGHGGA